MAACSAAAAFGAAATIAGECVFNTSMTGYQEIITDPSYFGQIVTMTAVQVGNYGHRPRADEEYFSAQSARVSSSASSLPSSPTGAAQISLDAYLAEIRHPRPQPRSTPARSTKKLRVDGAMKSCLSTLPALRTPRPIKPAPSAWQDMAGSDYVEGRDLPRALRTGQAGDAAQPQRRIPPRRHDVQRLPAHAEEALQGRRLRLRRETHDLPQTRPPRLRRASVPQPPRPHEQVREHGVGRGVPLQRPRRPGRPRPTSTRPSTKPPARTTRSSASASATRCSPTPSAAPPSSSSSATAAATSPVKNLETGKVSITAQNHGFATDPASRSSSAAPSRHRDQPQRQHRRRPAPHQAPRVQRPIPPRGRSGPQRRRPTVRRFLQDGRSPQSRKNLVGSRAAPQLPFFVLGCYPVRPSAEPALNSPVLRRIDTDRRVLRSVAGDAESRFRAPELLQLLDLLEPADGQTREFPTKPPCRHQSPRCRKQGFARTDAPSTRPATSRA